MKSRNSLGKNGSLILNKMAQLGKEVFTIKEAERATKLYNSILKVKWSGLSRPVLMVS